MKRKPGGGQNTKSVLQTLCSSTGVVAYFPTRMAGYVVCPPSLYLSRAVSGCLNSGANCHDRCRNRPGCCFISSNVFGTVPLNPSLLEAAVRRHEPENLS